MCWDVGEVRVDVSGKVWRKIRGDVEGVKKGGGRCRRVYRVNVENVEKCVGVWRKVREDVSSVKGRGRCGRVYGVSVKNVEKSDGVRGKEWG